jgi:hypothetical protein
VRRGAALAVLGALALAGWVGAKTAPAAVRVLVVGPKAVLAGPRTVSARATHVKTSAPAKRCLAPAGTALAALAGRRRAGGPAFAVRDYGGGSCDPLFVTRIGGFTNRGVSGWTYKVGHRAGTTAADDPSGPFGTGRRILAGARVEWFWCRIAAGGCQRTLAIAPARRRVAPGASLRVRVRGYDDRGRAKNVGGARVTLGAAAARSNGSGIAALTVPSSRGIRLLRATKPGLADGFPERVEVR